VDGTTESAAALRWACREAGLRGAEVHAVHVWEAPCHAMASYAAPSQSRPPEDIDFEVFWAEMLPSEAAGVPVRTEVALGLPARVLLQRSEGADMLVLGTAGDQAGRAGSGRPAGPVLRACLRRSSCPVVVIGAEPEPAAAHGIGVVPLPAGLPG
jgi:nucleotide-binding universal stress UspA family protein